MFWKSCKDPLYALICCFIFLSPKNVVHALFPMVISWLTWLILFLNESFCFFIAIGLGFLASSIIAFDFLYFYSSELGLCAMLIAFVPAIGLLLVTLSGLREASMDLSLTSNSYYAILLLEWGGYLSLLLELLLGSLDSVRAATVFRDLEAVIGRSSQSSTISSIWSC